MTQRPECFPASEQSATRLDPGTSSYGKTRLRRFRFNRPQRIAAALLGCLLVECAWRIGDEQAVTQAQTPVLARALAQMAGWVYGWLPASLGPEPAWVAALPFVAAALALGGALWWVTRRQFGNRGGYTALALYCFSPVVVQAAVRPGTALLAALGVYGGIYTAIGVSHAMQGPRRKWRPRIVLLTAAFTLAGAASPLALAATALLGLALMLWVGEGRRRLIVPIVGVALGGALLLWAVGCTVVRMGLVGAERNRLVLSHAASSGGPFVAIAPLRASMAAPGAWLAQAGLGVALLIALALYAGVRRSRFFGNTAPLLVAVALPVVAWPRTGVWLWALPFGLTFVAGVLADAYESRWLRLAHVAAVLLVLAQVAACVAALAGVR